MKTLKPKPPKPVKTIRRWCIATRIGGLVNPEGFGIFNYDTREQADQNVVYHKGERAALIELREVTRG